MLQGAPVAVDTQILTVARICLLHPAIGKLLSTLYRVAYTYHVDQATLAGSTCRVDLRASPPRTIRQAGILWQRSVATTMDSQLTTIQPRINRLYSITIKLNQCRIKRITKIGTWIEVVAKPCCLIALFLLDKVLR